MDTTDLLLEIKSDIAGWVTFADAKAVGLLAVNGVLISALVQDRHELSEALASNVPFQILSLITVITILLSSFFSLRCISPSITGAKRPFFPWKKQTEIKSSLLFFGHISKLSNKEYEDRLIHCLGQEDTIHSEIIQQISMNSNIATTKYHSIRQATYFIIWGIMLVPILLVIIL